MSSDSDQAWRGQAPSSPLTPAPRRWPWVLLILILVLAGAGGGVYAWPYIAPLVPSLGNAASGDKMAAGDKDALPDILATQQKLEDGLAALGRSVADQQQQLKTVADQLTDLTAKVDALQRATPAPAPPPAAAELPRAPAAQVAPRPRRPPVRAPKPSGPISTGGAPLNTTPSDTDR
jgi:uncharacterized coiled-coil protein SlyX